MLFGAVRAVGSTLFPYTTLFRSGEGDGAGAGIVEAADREGDRGRLRTVDDVVAGGVDRQGHNVGVDGGERVAVIGGRGGVALAVAEAQRGRDAAVIERMQVGAVG